MKVSRIITQLRTTDIDASIDFFLKVLGFDLAFKFSDFYAGISVAGQLFHLKLVDEKDPSIKFVADNGHFHLFIELDDVDTMAEHIRQHGGELQNEVHDTDWDTREFSVIDDQGHTIYFAQAL